MESTGFFTEVPFRAWSMEHLSPVIIAIVIGGVAITWNKKKPRAYQKKSLLILSIVPAIALIIYTLMKIVTGAFTIENDLPIHLCRLLALAAPIVYFVDNKFWTGIFYFWITVGTFNAVITPDVKFGFPHWEYLVYFIMHVGLVVLPFYYIFVMNHRITRSDLWNAFWMSNAFLVLTLALNYLIDSNYMFTRHKPEVATLLDVLGPWPWYLLSVQFIGLILFHLVYLPFAITKK